MFKTINRCDIFVALSILYSMQGLLYPSGIINQLLQLIMILWSLTVAVKYMVGIDHRSKILRATSVLVVMYSIYGGFILLFGHTCVSIEDPLPSTYIYLQVSLRSLLPIFLFYHYTKRGYLTEKRIRIYAILILASTIPMYYFRSLEIMMLSGKEEVTNNIGYEFMSLLPLALFFKKKPLWQYIFLSLTLLFVVMAMKRGAIIIAILCSLIILYGNYKSGTTKQRFMVVFLSIFLIVLAFGLIRYMMATSEYFMLRVEQTMEGDSSNRDILYNEILSTVFSDDSIIRLLFGRGADGSFSVAGNYAHQDWLETLCNNGVVGVLILLSFFLSLFRTAFNAKSFFPEPMYFAFLAVFVCAFSKTMFSMSIQNLHISQTLLIGYFACCFQIVRSRRQCPEVNRQNTLII